jgi:hypothetical protein
MREGGARVEHAGGAFPFGTRDEVWLTAGGVFWSAKPSGHPAIRLSGAAVFALTVGEATAAETADVITKLLAKMVNTSVGEPKPFLYTFGLAGRLNRIRLAR